MIHPVTLDRNAPSEMRGFFFEGEGEPEERFLRILFREMPMTPLSPGELLELLTASHDEMGLPIDAQNLVAAARLVVDRLADVFRDKGGVLRVRLRKH